MSRFEGVSNLPGKGQRLVDRNRPTSYPIRQGLAGDQFHRQEMAAVVFFQAEQGGDVRMIQRREDFGFTLEPRGALGVRGERLGQHLERNVPIQSGVARSIHLPHAPGADQADDLVDTQPGARNKSHWHEWREL